MNKNILKIIIPLFIVLILAGAVYYGWILPNKKDSHGCLVNKGSFWCGFKEKCVKTGEEDCVLTQDWIVGEAKKIMGLDLNIMPEEVIKWKTENGEIVFSAKGFVYTDLLGAEKITKSYADIENLLKKIGFGDDDKNPLADNGKQKTTKYNKEKIVCSLMKTDISNETSSILFLCGNVDDEICSFNSDCGRSCAVDSDCKLVVDGCAKRVVCRNGNFEFYQDCQNPTAIVEELDARVLECSCVDNICQPKNEKWRPWY